MRPTSVATIAVTLAAALLAGIALAGCGGGEVPDAPRVDVERASGEPRCTDTSALAVFGSSDGFTFAHTVALCANGRVDLHYSARFVGPLGEARLGYEIAASDVRRIEQALGDADFASLGESYMSQAADITVYRVTYSGKTVYADEFEIRDGNVPLRLLGLIRLFGSVLGPAVADAENWIREDPAPVLRYREEETRKLLESCRSSTRLKATGRRQVERLRGLLEGGLTVAEVKKVDALLGVVERC